MRKGNLAVDAKPESIGLKLNCPPTKKKLTYFRQAKPVTFLLSTYFPRPLFMEGRVINCFYVSSFIYFLLREITSEML